MNKSVNVAIRFLMVGFMAAFLSGCGDSSEQVAHEDVKKSHGLIKEVKPSLPGKAFRDGKKDAKAKRKGHRQRMKKLTKEERLKKIQQKVNKRLQKIRDTAADEVDPSLSPKDQALVKGLNAALADENLKAVSDAAVGARSSANPEVRSRAVEALSWFGEKALTDLTAFLADADEGVAADAEAAWEQGLSEIEDEKTRLEYIETAMKSLDGREMLDSIAMNYNSIEDEAAAVSSLIRVIDSGNGTGVEVAKETYEFITGDEWTGKNDAWKWVGDAQKAAAAEAQEGQ